MKIKSTSFCSTFTCGHCAWSLLYGVGHTCFSAQPVHGFNSPESSAEEVSNKNLPFWRCLSILAAVTKCWVVYEDRDVFLTGLLLEMSRVLADSVSGEDQPYDHRWHSQSSHDTEGVWAPLGLSCKDSLRVLIWWTNTLQRPPFDIIPGDWMSVDEFGARGTHKASNNSRGLLDVLVCTVLGS